MNSDKMDIIEFGEALLRTRDLDPVYCAVHDAKLPRDQLYRWLLAYWCFYHVGVASFMSEQKGGSYWDFMAEAAENKPPGPHIYKLPSDRWPRAAERRHFRGAKCVEAVRQLQAMYPKPELAVRDLILPSEKAILRKIKDWYLFGSWIGFKAADMLERCAGAKVSFDEGLGLIYSEPRKTLDLLAERNGGTAEDQWKLLLKHFSKIQAPPALDRGCGPSECETVACKYGSYLNGHYWVGKDIHEQRPALKGWGKTAEKILKSYPEEVER